MKIVKAQGTDSEPPANDDDAGGSVGRQVIRAQELERKRIAKELHDGIAQSAGVIKYNIEASIATLSRLDPSLDLGLLEAVVGQTRSLLEEVRRISTNLAPSMLDDFGLCVALQALCDEFRSDTCDFQPTCSACVDESDMPNLVKIAVYRVAQEALNNISKHASATTVKVTVSTSDAGLCLEVSDNGVGLTPGMQASLEANPGSGLQNMRERVESTNGEFSIDAAPGGGTVVRANWNQAALDLLSDEAILDGINSYS
jgi:signal transduction histidine kinase